MCAMFADAKTTKTGSKSKKNEKEQVAVKGLEVMAAIDHIMKSMTALKTTVAIDVKDQMINHFVKQGCAQKKRPGNFQGYEGEATASCELRIRASNSPLSDIEKTLLVGNKIPVETVETVVATFVINPAYANDMKLLSRIEGALKKLKDIPEDLFLKQEGVSKTIVSKNALDVMFSKPQKIAAALIDTVGVLAVKPKLGDDEEGMSNDDAYEIVQAYINGVEEDDE